jgi:hypothetical protein
MSDLNHIPKDKLADIQDTSVEIKIWSDDLACTEFVDLFNEKTQLSVEAFVQAGLITEQRKVEILNV